MQNPVIELLRDIENKVDDILENEFKRGLELGTSMVLNYGTTLQKMKVISILENTLKNFKERIGDK